MCCRTKAATAPACGVTAKAPSRSPVADKFFVVDKDDTARIFDCALMLLMIYREIVRHFGMLLSVTFTLSAYASSRKRVILDVFINRRKPLSASVLKSVYPVGLFGSLIRMVVFSQNKSHKLPLSSKSARVDLIRNNLSVRRSYAIRPSSRFSISMSNGLMSNVSSGSKSLYSHACMAL